MARHPAPKGIKMYHSPLRVRALNFLGEKFCVKFFLSLMAAL